MIDLNKIITVDDDGKITDVNVEVLKEYVNELHNELLVLTNRVKNLETNSLQDKSTGGFIE